MSGLLKKRTIMRRPFDQQLSYRLDWVICRMEATRGWRRLWWRLVKRWLELGIGSKRHG